VSDVLRIPSHNADRLNHNTSKIGSNYTNLLIGRRRVNCYDYFSVASKKKNPQFQFYLLQVRFLIMKRFKLM
jgi:hypothetical protein